MSDLLVLARTLSELEAVIEQGVQTFVDVGTALREIRERDLHHEAGYKNFDTYCQERWGFSRSYSTRLISAAEVVTIVTTSGLPAPANEGQARALVQVEPEERAAVWHEVVETAPKDGHGAPKVTARHVEETVSRVSEPKPRKPRAPRINGTITADDLVKTASKPEQPSWLMPEKHTDALRREGIPEDAEYAARLIQRNFDAAWIAYLVKLLSPDKSLEKIVRRAAQPQPQAGTSKRPAGGQRERILSSLPAGASLTPSQLAAASGLPYKAITQRTTELVREGKLIRSGETGRFRYSLAVEP